MDRAVRSRRIAHCRRELGLQHSMSIEAIRSDFALLDDWEDRYRYLIELGRDLAPLPESLRTEANKVRGCASQVWLASTAEPPSSGKSATLHFQGDSDAHIVRGLIAVLFALFDGRTAEEILRTDARAVFAGLGLSEHLTPQRSNGFFSMVERIRRDAETLGKAA
jgi:cysteine desulfuration protein SufE